MPRILPLPADAIAQIHSSKHIISLQGVVLSLLENSLDAGSNKVEITVNFRRGGCVLEDDGGGIPSAEFLEDGGLAKMYRTSKRRLTSEREVHGSTGTYLASLAALSLLNVTSRHIDQEELSTLTIHRGEVIARQVPAPSAHELTLSRSHGTCITVRDLFGNMPVRVKQRALISEASNFVEKAWQELKRGVVALMLAWPRPCAVRIRSIDHDGRVLQLSVQHPSVSVALTEKSLNRIHGEVMNFELKDALPILFQAGLAPAGSRNRWVPVSASTARTSVKGFICLDPAPTRQCQFVGIGIYPCSTTSGHNDLYDAVNKVFTNSSFGSIDDESDIDEAEKDRRRRDRRYKIDGYTQNQLHGRKGVDRWPMLILQIKFKDQRNHSSIDNMSESSLKGIVEVLEATVTQWLIANHFRPRKRTRRKNQDQHSPAVSSSLQRSSSAEPRPRSGLVSSDLATPSLKRTATAQSATPSKKRRVLDVYARSHTLDDTRSPTTRGPSGYFSTWSRIKSGSGAFYDDIWQGRKPATAPAGQTGWIKLPPTGLERSKFHLPTLEAGELTSAKGSSGEISATSLISPATPIRQTARKDEFLNEDFGSADDDDMLAALETVERSVGETLTDTDSNLPNDPIIDWTDPTTRQSHKVNARTGVVLPSRPKPITIKLSGLPSEPTAASCNAAINTSVSSIGKPLSLSKRRAGSAPAQGESRWLPGFLIEWNNPVFVRQDEERIPLASLEGPGIDAAQAAATRCTHKARTDAFAEAGAAGMSKLSRTTLRDARVIRQVDRKFIMCKIQASDNGADCEVLALIDQHAASERVILEGLLAQLCETAEPFAPGKPMSKSTESRLSIKVVRIEKLLRFQISATEYQLFHAHAQHFANWGILYELLEKEERVTASQVQAPKLENTIIVTTLPPGIAERCTLVPKLLIELLRSEVWSVAESGTKQPKSDGDDPCCDSEDKIDGQRHPWLKRIGSCPRGMLEMLNSRACRSAIMFNDELSIAQCQELVVNLSTCAFPFMCAHGRVSMVPLVELGLGNVAESTAGFFDMNNKATRSFTSAFTEFTQGTQNG